MRAVIIFLIYHTPYYVKLGLATQIRYALVLFALLLCSLICVPFIPSLKRHGVLWHLNRIWNPLGITRKAQKKWQLVEC